MSFIYSGDCFDQMLKIPDQSIDMILCDPPYGITCCDWDKSILPLEEMWSHYRRVTKPNAAIVIFASQPFTSVLITSNLQMFRYAWVWVKNRKTGFLNAKLQPLRQTEDICVFYKNPPVYNPQMSYGHKPVNSYTKHTSDGATVGRTKLGVKGGGSTSRYPSNMLMFDAVKNDNSKEPKFHPTQKPVALCEYLIKTYTNEGDMVLDNCAGSGTTGEACLRLNRNFTLIEIDPDFVDIIKLRLVAEGK